MSKKAKNLLIGFVVLLALAGGLIPLMLMERPQHNVNSEIPTTTVVLTDKEETSVVEIAVKNKKESYTIVRPKNGKLAIKALAKYPRNDATYSQAVAYAAKMSATALVEEAPKDIKKYGLEKPQATLKVKFDDKESSEFLIGDKAPDGSSYYSKIRGVEAVYIIDETKLSMFLGSKFDYIDPSLTTVDFPETAEGEDDGSQNLPAINKFVISRKDLDKPIIFTTAKNRSTKEAIAALECKYQIDSPIKAKLDIEKGSAPVSSFYGMTASKVVDVNITAEKREKYGFNNPEMTLQMDAKKKKFSHKLTIGKMHTCADLEDAGSVEKDHVHEAAGYYAMFDDNDIVYTMHGDDLTWLTLNVKDILAQYVLTPSIDEVKNIIVKLDGKTHRFDISEFKTNEAGTKDVFTVKMDGEKLNSEKFQDFYVFLGGIETTDVLTGNVKKNTKMTVTYNYRTKKEPDTLELTPYGNSKMAISYNGVMGFTSRSTFLTRAAENLEKLAAGKTINPYW